MEKIEMTEKMEIKESLISDLPDAEALQISAAPWLQASTNPAFRSFEITRMKSLKRRRTSSVLSVEALSTTTISTRQKSISLTSELRHCQVNSALLKTGMTIEVSITRSPLWIGLVSARIAAASKSTAASVGVSQECGLVLNTAGRTRSRIPRKNSLEESDKLS